MPVGKDEFRTALGHFASGVTVVTTSGKDGSVRGMTVSAFSSLSLDPPLVLICVENRTSIYEHLNEEGGFFAVNILAEDQELVSRRFATKDTDRFDGIGYTTGATGSPILTGALAFVECRVVNAYPGGDHTIFVGEVEAMGATEGKPLAYFRGGYSKLV
jgi:flavin reductase (DIM6/NTAB) family NADH-FMN oxidoreductase RutF